MKLTELLLEITSNEALAYLLGDKGKVTQIGNESGKFNTNGVSLFQSPFGSYRYVMSIDGNIVSALQIMSRDGKVGKIANAFTHKDYRRKGYGKQLFNYAKKKFNKIEHSDDLSDIGKLFAKGTK